jgi:N-acetylneuraminic acid mutarotase
MATNESLAWSRVETTNSPPQARSGHSAVVYHDCMYIFGGLGEYRFNDLFKFDFESRTWTEIKAIDESRVPSKRCKHSACIYQNMMYIFGGWDSSGKLNDMYRYIFDRNEWEIVPCSNPPPARSAHSVAIYQNYMYLFAGIGDNKYNDMYRFSFKTNQWSVVNQRNPPPRRSSYGGAHVYNDRLYVVCGLGCGKFNDCHSFDFHTLEWTELKYSDDSRVIPAKRGRHTCILSGENLYMFGGYVGIQRSNELFTLNLRTNQWKQIKLSTNTPAAREGHSAVLYKNSMWLFGGWHDNGWYNDVYTLGPV